MSLGRQCVAEKKAALHVCEHSCRVRWICLSVTFLLNIRCTVAQHCYQRIAESVSKQKAGLHVSVPFFVSQSDAGISS